MRFLSAVTVIAVVGVALRAQDEPFGHLDGKGVAEWLADGRHTKLDADFPFVDQFGLGWDAPKGPIVDGASIPRFLWSIAGGPFEGKDRNASVVHDVACVRRHREWRNVHRMFYNASLLGGVGKLKAKVMYGFVFFYGPRWSVDSGVRMLRTEDDLLRWRQYYRGQS